MAMQNATSDKRLPNGPAAAAILAGGIGCFFMGLITLISEVIVSSQNLLK